MSATATEVDETLFWELVGEVEDYTTETGLSYTFTNSNAMFDVFENALVYSIEMSLFAEGHFISPKNRFELYVEDNFIWTKDKNIFIPEIIGVIDFNHVKEMKLYLPSEIGYDFFRVELKYVDTKNETKKFFSVFDFYL